MRADSEYTGLYGSLALPRTEAARPRMVRQPLSVAIYTHDLAGGGVERQILMLISELQARGMSVVLVLHSISGELRGMLPANLRVVSLNSRRTLYDVPGLARFLRAEKPDVLLANIDHNNIAALLGARLAMSRTRVVICQHNTLSSDFREDKGWSYRLIPMAYRLLRPFMDGVVAVSDGIADELHTLAHIPRHKIHLIHNAVIGPDFRGRAVAPVAHPWFDNPAEPVFVTAGRLVGLKDHDMLLRALAIHRQHHPGRLMILGVGPLQQRLEALTRELGLTEAVTFLGFRDNPLPYFRRADAFVLGSYSEGFGNVLVEAMGCGTPVISTDCEYGPAEILDGGRYGVLVPPRSPPAMAEAFAGVATLRQRFPEETLKARAAAFSDQASASRYVEFFYTLTRSAERRAAG